MAKEKTKKVELVAKNGTKASDITMQYMFDYCNDIGDADALDWFIEITERKVEYDKYPLSDAPVNEGGRRKRDKTKEPVKATRKLTYPEIKKEFIEKFYPELIPAKKPKATKAPSWHEKAVAAKALKEGKIDPLSLLKKK